MTEHEATRAEDERARRPDADGHDETAGVLSRGPDPREEPPPHEPRPTAASHLPPPPARVPPVIVPRWVQLVLLPIALLALYALARAAGTVLVVFLVAGIVALILNPLVKLLQRGRMPHGLAVLTVYIGLLAVLVGIGILLVNPISAQVESFQKDVPSLVRSANTSLAGTQKWLNQHGVNVQIKKQGQTALQTLQRTVLKRSGSLVSYTRDLLQKIAELSFALVLIVVISIYMLVYASSIGRLVRNAMPRGDGSPEDDFPLRAQKAVFGYVRGQLLFSLIMGASTGAALWLVGTLGVFPAGRSYALAFGAFYGVMELVPYVGPVLGAIPPIVVALLNHPLDAIWLVILFVAMQQLEGHVVAPQVFGRSLRINPLLIIFSLLFGAELYGIVGAFIALPIAAIARETVVYLRRHLVFEPWGQPSAPPLSPTGMLGSGEAGEACPACGAGTDPEDSACGRCGSPLRSRLGAPG